MRIEQHKEACSWYDRDISIPALIVPSLEYLKDISYFSPENIAEKIKGLTPQSSGLNTLPEAIISCRNGKIEKISCNKECMTEIIKLCTKADAAEFIKVLDSSIFKKVLFERAVLEVFDFLVLILDREKIYEEYTNLINKVNYINIGTIDVAYRKRVLEEFLRRNNAIQLQKIIGLLPFTLCEDDIVVRISSKLRDEFIGKLLGEDLLAFQRSVEKLENAVLGEIYRNGFGSAYLTALKDRLNNY